MCPLVVLALAPKDEDALLCKIVANVQLAQYDAALSLIAKHGQTLGDKVMFEKVHTVIVLAQCFKTKDAWGWDLETFWQSG